MFHYNVLVAADSEAQLEARLLPYHKYECTGIEQYVVWIDEHDTVMQEYQNHCADYETLEMFVKNWHGYTKDRQGRYGRRTNPNAKWDWWTIGGRWADMLSLSRIPDVTVNFATKGDIDWTRLKSRQLEQHMKKYTDYHKAWSQVIHEFFPYGLDVSSLQKNYDEQGMRGDQRRTWFPSFQEYVSHHRIQQILAENKCWLRMQTFDELHQLRTSSPDQYRELFQEKALTYAFIRLDGQWTEQSNMGWWGITFNENNDYDQQFWAWIETLPNYQGLYLVDCHI